MSRTKLFSFTVLIVVTLLSFAHLLTSTFLQAQDAPAVIPLIKQPVTISQNQNGYNIYAIDSVTGKALKALHIELDDVNALGVPAEMTLLGQSANPFTGEMINVYRLSSGEFQLDTADSNNQIFSVKWNENGTLTRNPVS